MLRNPIKLSVMKNKGCVYVLSFGENSKFAVISKREKTVQGVRKDSQDAFVMHGMILQTHCSERDWIFHTKVEQAQDGNKAYYMCYWVAHPELNSGWRKNPSQAYVAANQVLAEGGFATPKFKPKENGAMLVGVTYPGVQQAIREHFALPPADRAGLVVEQEDDDAPAAKRQRVAAAAPELSPASTCSEVEDDDDVLEDLVDVVGTPIAAASEAVAEPELLPYDMCFFEEEFDEPSGLLITEEDQDDLVEWLANSGFD